MYNYVFATFSVMETSGVVFKNMHFFYIRSQNWVLWSLHSNTVATYSVIVQYVWDWFNEFQTKGLLLQLAPLSLSWAQVECFLNRGCCGTFIFPNWTFPLWGRFQFISTTSVNQSSTMSCFHCFLDVSSEGGCAFRVARPKI